MSDTSRVTEEVKQAQREAKEDAERIVAKKDRPDTSEMSEGRTDVDEDDMGILMCLLQVKAICVDEPNEASYLSGYVGINFSKCGRYLPTTKQTQSRTRPRLAEFIAPTSQSMGGTIRY